MEALSPLPRSSTPPLYSSSFMGAPLLPPTFFLRPKSAQLVRERRGLCAAKGPGGGAQKRPLKKDPKQMLSHILRTEAAVLAVEKKAKSPKSRRLWPKAVLEALDDAIAADRWESALKIFELLRRQIWYNPIPRTYARLLTMLGRCGQPERASALFQTLLSDGLKPTADVYTSLLGAYGFNGLLDEAFRTVEDMKSIFDCKPDVYTYTILISCCCKQHRFDLIPKVLTEMTYLGIDCSIVTYNIIIDGFGKAGMVEEMENYFATMLENSNCLPDVYTMNSILWAYGNKGKIKEVEKSYNEFQLMGLEPDVTTFNILIRSYGKAAMDGKIDSVMEYMEKRFFSPTSITYNILIECFGKAGNIKNMEHYFRLMKYRGIKPDSVTYCSLISAYSVAGLIEKVPAIVRQIENSNVSFDTPLFNCLLSAYGKVGNVEMMEEMFFWMKQSKCSPDAITFATMIQAYNSLGMTKAADKLEAEILKLKERSLIEDDGFGIARLLADINHHNNLSLQRREQNGVVYHVFTDFPSSKKFIDFKATSTAP